MPSVHEGTRIQIVISEPWEFHNENEEHGPFNATVLRRVDDGWLVRFDDALRQDGDNWRYGVVTHRFREGYEFSANIYFLGQQQALSSDWLSKHFADRRLRNPSVVGALSAPDGGDVQW
jgi:hypothetical protein